MTQINPLVKNKIDNKSSYHDMLYENLAMHAKENIKPNEAKAKIIKEGPVTSVVSYFKDTAQDCVNFANVVKTGKISDNNLGRINDLGLKGGALLIASFLALHAKTKTDAIMKFVGGGAFLASMSLWPKIFINLPARLIHGFPVDQRYISAQGDKKDFLLDNQFIVWDAQDEKDMRKYAKNAHIDYDGENGKEKIQRKIQKTGLQCRTLNLATAGIASPLMTSLFGHFIQPKIQKAVIGHDANKALKVVNWNLDKYLNDAKPDVRNVKEINELCNSYSNKELDKDFYEKLAKFFNIGDLHSTFKNSDDYKVIEQYNPRGLIEAFEKIQSEKCAIDTKTLEKDLKAMQGMGADPVAFLTGEVKAAPLFSEAQVKEIIEKLGSDKTSAKLIEILRNDYNLQDGPIDEIVQTLKFDNSEFFETIKTYNQNVMGQIRGRVKAYLKLLNPIAGSKSESLYSEQINGVLNNIIKTLGFDDYKTLKQIKENGDDFVAKLMSDTIAKRVEGVQYGSEEYKKIIQDFSIAPIEQETKTALETLIKEENLDKLKVQGGIEALNDAILGTKEMKGSLSDAILSFMNIKNMDLEALRSKAIMAANFEVRRQMGEFSDFNKEQLEIAKEIIYRGNAAVRNNFAYARNQDLVQEVISKIFNKEMFSCEEGLTPGIKETVENLLNARTLDITGGGIWEEAHGVLIKPLEQYTKTGSVSEIMKKTATDLYNNKSWLRKFGGMAIILAAVTLLIQPLFGKIQKEYPQDKENRGAK